MRDIVISFADDSPSFRHDGSDNALPLDLTGKKPVLDRCLDHPKGRIYSVNQGLCFKLMDRFVAYYRVSTRSQGRSGLGLEAQANSIQAFVQERGTIIGEFTDIESGRSDVREALWKAIHLAKREGATLLIARLDRFSRRVSFIADLMEKGVRLQVVDMPHASDFQLHIFAALAQEERRLISIRTKAALAAAKARGTTLGKNGARLALERKLVADQFADELASAIGEGWAHLGHSEIARRLNDLGYRTPTGRQFHPQSVKNYRQRMPLSSNMAEERG